MKYLLSIVTLFLLPGMLLCEEKSDEQLIKIIGDKIIERHQTGFIDRKTNEIYDTTKDIPKDTPVYFRSPTMDWHYANGVVNMAMIRLSGFLNNPAYFKYAENQIDYCLNNYSFFEKRKELNSHELYHFMWKFCELDHCGAEVSAMLDILQVNPGKNEYRIWVDKTIDHIRNIQERTGESTLVRSWPFPETLWADDLYMGLVFLARQGKYSGDKSLFDDAVNQVRMFNKYLWNPTKELFHHAYYFDLQTVGGYHWGRCNGWVMLAITLLIDAMPDSNPDKAEMINFLKRQIKGVANYQASSGLWHQLIDKPDSYSESSASSIFVYCIAKAINNGWLDERYASIALDGWSGLRREKITEDGNLKDVCVGTGIGNNLLFYYNRPTQENEVHGLGLILEAGIEIIELKKKLTK